MFLHYGPGGKGVQWAISWGEPRNSAVVHIQPSGPRASAWSGEYLPAALCWRTCGYIHVSALQHVMSAARTSFVRPCLPHQGSNRYLSSWRHSPPLFLNMILIKLLLLSFPGRLIAVESLNNVSKRNTEELYGCSWCHYPIWVNVCKWLGCVAPTVHHKCCQGTGHLLLAAHAGQGAEFCQRPLPDGQRDPQPASPAKT